MIVHTIQDPTIDTYIKKFIVYDIIYDLQSIEVIGDVKLDSEVNITDVVILKKSVNVSLDSIHPTLTDF